ncbi:E3 SUMO-protein ligase ZBED1-like [Corythoichthys intestinalis]|uniref:E3 SUMO-protein ligase ZBED1-like n=1 Tax=Corythoichthys intestinalis TaxID=161448 RepID=UPI0025A5D3E5|nr:E3 SUMO-protein ligase ZBED1-like [Corythoichthys intestinalis]
MVLKVQQQPCGCKCNPDQQSSAPPSPPATAEWREDGPNSRVEGGGAVLKLKVKHARRENIAAALKEAVASWNLDEEHLVCITSDNAANIVRAASLNKWTRLQCFGHRLHLAVENAVKKSDKIDRALSICKKLVGHFSHSWKARAALEDAQKELNLPSHSLITECQTRWGSRQMMISRILEQQRALAQVLSKDKKTRHLIPTWQDIDVLESVSKSLDPLLDFTDALSGEDYISISCLKPVLHLFNTQLLQGQDEETDLTKKLKKEMLDYINEKYEDKATQELLDIASCLDPRFKMDFIDADKKPQVKARVTTELMECHAQTSSALFSAASSSSTEENPTVANPPQEKKSKKSFGGFFQSIQSKAGAAGTSSSLTLRESVEAEFNNYLLTPCIDKDQDALAWWKIYQINFPRLSKLACKYLCIPATSSPSERLFSASGNIVTCQRSCLKPEMVDKLVFLAKNL